MGQAGAQREPSMEEILASIRRIIENNEPAQQDGAGQSADAMSDRADEPMDWTAGAAARPVAANEEHVRPPLSLAEVAAQSRPLAPARENAEVEPAASETAASDGEVDEAAAEELREALMSDAPVDAPVAAGDDAFDDESTEHAAETAEPADAPDAPHGHESAGHLVSLHTGEKVAAAFSELDAAIAAGQRRSFDEIAEEMLRPMLTHWLDDNLPTLVERLVREEIERVSRGNRR